MILRSYGKFSIRTEIVKEKRELCQIDSFSQWVDIARITGRVSSEYQSNPKTASF
jgi:hypothetical protein